MTDSEGDREAELLAAERRLGRRFPEDYRRFIKDRNGLEGFFGDVYIALYPIDRVVELNEIHEHLAHQPQLIHIGSDGGGEAIAFDFRHEPPAVVLVNMVSSDWSDVIIQAESFDGFMEQRRRGANLRWSGGHG